MTEATILMQTTTIACSGCGAALAPDQHYCLHCGTAAQGERVAYRELIPPAVAAPPAPPVLPPAPVPAAVLAPRDWTPVIALGGLAALGLVLVVGILIGRSSIETTPAAAPAPQVITIGSAAPAAADAGDSDAEETDGDGASGRRARRALAQKAQRDKQALEDLESSSGSDYQRKSARLPDTVALPGEPPPRDNEAPGGGSEAETIG